MKKKSKAKPKSKRITNAQSPWRKHKTVLFKSEVPSGHLERGPFGRVTPGDEIELRHELAAEIEQREMDPDAEPPEEIPEE
jgi:hypothetical protein